MLTGIPEKAVVDYLCGSIACTNEIEAKDLCKELLALPLEKIPALLLQYSAIHEVTTGNIPQLSDLSIALYRVPRVLVEANVPLSYEELGSSIYPSRLSGAQGKYGEGHGKLATALDLASCAKQNHHWRFASAPMGKLFCELPQEDKDQLLQRLCYRVPIIQHMVTSNDPIAEMDRCLSILAETTRKRRRRNVLDLYAFATNT